MICFSWMKLSRAGAGPRTRHGTLAAFAAASIALAPFASPPAHAGTTVTRYQYNADGALTAVTTRTGIANTTTTYLTWDDFVPNEDDPTTGTVYSGNGNLLAIGPKPGSGSSLFSFDNRDRLTSFSGADKSAAYGYHADGLMASSTAADKSGFGFYYIGSDMSNLHQTDTDQWSARLGPVRYLDDGSEEVLLTPRKDVAATYDPSSNTVSSYDYDSFGAEEGAPLSSAYDLKDNPHRYAGEYRDPLWGGYYLQARWYDPDLATFLSRDPVAGFHPYSYGDGSPVMNTDPTGMSSKHDVGTEILRFFSNAFYEPIAQMFTAQVLDRCRDEQEPGVGAAVFRAGGRGRRLGDRGKGGERHLARPEQQATRLHSGRHRPACQRRPSWRQFRHRRSYGGEFRGGPGLSDDRFGLDPLRRRLRRANASDAGNRCRAEGRAIWGRQCPYLPGEGERYASPVVVTCAGIGKNRYIS